MWTCTDADLLEACHEPFGLVHLCLVSTDALEANLLLGEISKLRPKCERARCARRGDGVRAPNDACVLT